MSTGRSKPKSHYGCVPCKKRKIKCDENHPQCNRCIKRGVSCQYQGLPIKSILSTSGVPQGSTPAYQSSDHDSPRPIKPQHLFPPHEGDTLRTFLVTSPPSQGGLQDYSKSDFELLHHYTINTYRSFAETNALEHLWSVTVPQEAFAYDFLLHGILALAGFHLSHLHPSQQAHYDALAKRHYTLSISSFREQLQDPSKEAGGALLASSIVAVVTTFANASTATSSEERSGGALDDLIGVAALQRGVPAIVGAVQGSVRQQGILAPIVDAWKTPPVVVELPDGIQKALERLEVRCSHSCPNNVEDYRAAIEHLRSGFQRALSKHSRLLALEWFILLSDGFISAARARERAAVAILAHFGVVLHYCKDFWWIGSEGKKVVEEAVEVLGEDCDWADWAKSEVGSG
ncbi:MAG: hypothetical protein M1835_003824 [Candelina submexicana]|nr:MAG: hypothetical protein M1835_003824 [Candelina submexicana]